MSSDDGNILPFPATSGTANLKGGGGAGTYDPMEARVKALEDALVDIKVTLGRLDERTSSLASKEDVARLAGDVGRLVSKEDVARLGIEVGKLQGEMKGVLTFWQFLTVVGVLLAVLLRWPELFRMAGIIGPS